MPPDPKTSAEVNSYREEHHTKRHTIRLNGERVRGARIAGSVPRELTDVLLDATRGALRLRVEGRSTSRGSLPSWLLAAADFDVVGFEANVMDSPRLRQPQGPRSGVNAIIGRWPGQESDEEIAAALRELS